jgi:hypothetical protein
VPSTTTTSVVAREVTRLSRSAASTLGSRSRPTNSPGETRESTAEERQCEKQQEKKDREQCERLRTELERSARCLPAPGLLRLTAPV